MIWILWTIGIIVGWALLIVAGGDPKAPEIMHVSNFNSGGIKDGAAINRPVETPRMRGYKNIGGK